jgi:hypothetical protein
MKKLLTRNEPIECDCQSGYAYESYLEEKEADLFLNACTVIVCIALAGLLLIVGCNLGGGNVTPAV